jgi:hypothetical protein
MRQATPRPLTAMFCITLMICICAFAPLCAGYSVLTHEEIIDLLWDQQIQPLLLARFPDASPQDLVKAHAYAYQAVVQVADFLHGWRRSRVRELTKHLTTDAEVRLLQSRF